MQSPFRRPSMRGGSGLVQGGGRWRGTEAGFWRHFQGWQDRTCWLIGGNREQNLILAHSRYSLYTTQFPLMPFFLIDIWDKALGKGGIWRGGTNEDWMREDREWVWAGEQPDWCLFQVWVLESYLGGEFPPSPTPPIAAALKGGEGTPEGSPSRSAYGLQDTLY